MRAVLPCPDGVVRAAVPYGPCRAVPCRVVPAIMCHYVTYGPGRVVPCCAEPGRAGRARRARARRNQAVIRHAAHA